MKITKRQLKRIIREEYSKLKRRGLLREMRGGMTSDPVIEDKVKMMLSSGGQSVLQADMLVKSLGYRDIFDLVPMDLGNHYVAPADPEYAQDAIDVAMQVGIPNPQVVGQVGGAESNYVIVTDGMGQYYFPLTFTEEEEFTLDEIAEYLDDAAQQDYY